MKLPRLLALCIALSVLSGAGCASTRENITYNPDWSGVKKLEKPVNGMLVPVADLRERLKAYPKQVIIQTDYSGNVTYDINDRTVEEVVTDALSAEFGHMGVNLIRISGMEGPLDKESADRIRKKLAAEHPDVQVAFGAELLDFSATSQRDLLTYKVHVTAWMKFYVLEVKTGDLLWSDYKTEWDDTVASVDHNYMIEQLDQALVNLMQKSIRDNNSLKELLLKVSKAG